MKHPGNRLVLLLACVVLTAMLASTRFHVFGQMANDGRTDDAQSTQQAKLLEEQNELDALMQDRRAVRGVTVRGQSIAEAPPFTATARKDELLLYPCTGCHDNEFVDNRVRELTDEHSDLVFEHGGGRFWCYDACHNGRDMDNLVSVRGLPIDYDRTYALCGQCHFQRQKDWYFGGHGKRAGLWRRPYEIPASYDEMDVSEREEIGSWRGERVLHNCTDCHDAHSPAIPAYEPSPAPQRERLLRGAVEVKVHEAIWDELARFLGGEK